MSKSFRHFRICIYAILLIVIIGGAYKGLSSSTYLKDYVEGFIARNIQFEKRTHHIWTDDDGRSDLAFILDVQDSILSNRHRFSELVDSIMSYNPSVLGLDIKLIPKDPVADSILYSTLARYDNIVLPYERVLNDRDLQYPLGKTYDDFANVCYSNFGALDDMPRFLAPYEINKDGQIRTSFWARLWEIHANIPNGQLKSKRQFINFNIKPNIHTVNCFEDLQNEDYVTFHDLTNRIVIIGNINGESGRKDIFHVPIQDSFVEDLSRTHLMTGIEIIGRSTLTIGDNELSNSIFDRNRTFLGYICFFILVMVFCLIHFLDCFSFIREYGNIFQFLAGIGLFFCAKYLMSPSIDEQWYFFFIVAIFLLLGPVVADFEKALYRIIGRKKDKK